MSKSSDNSNVLYLQTVRPDESDSGEDPTEVLHDIGNLVNHLSVTVGVVRRQWSAPQSVQKLRSFLSNAESNPELLTNAVAESPERLTAYLRALVDRIEREHANTDAELGRVSSTLEEMKGMIRGQQAQALGRSGGDLLDVATICDDVVAMLGDLASERGIVLSRSGDEHFVVVAERGRVLRILTNLVGNALDAVSDVSSERRRVEISTEAVEAGVRVSVTDHGVGIDLEHVEQIFQFGFSTKPDGHGFGLRACERAASEMGGSLRFFSDGPDAGATFVLTLPWRRI